MHPSGTCIQVCFGAKEIQDQLIQRFQNVAVVLEPVALMTGRARNAERSEKKQSERETFFFEMFCRFLAH